MSDVPESGLTLEELALIADGQADALGGKAARWLGELFRTDPRFAKEMAHFKALAREAGIAEADPVGQLHIAVLVHQSIDALLESEDWKHPEDVIAGIWSNGIPYENLVHLARVREEKAKDSGRIRRVRESLEEVLAAREAEQQLVTAFLDGLTRLPLARARYLVARVNRRQEFREEEERTKTDGAAS
jgi:hypothetical protein